MGEGHVLQSGEAPLLVLLLFRGPRRTQCTQGPQAEQSWASLLSVSRGHFPRRDTMKNVVWSPPDFSGTCCPPGPALASPQVSTCVRGPSGDTSARLPGGQECTRSTRSQHGDSSVPFSHGINSFGFFLTIYKCKNHFNQLLCRHRGVDSAAAAVCHPRSGCPPLPDSHPSCGTFCWEKPKSSFLTRCVPEMP